MTNSHTIQGKLAFGSDKRLYYALAGWDTQDAANRSVLVGRSEDMGKTWQTTIVRDTRGLTGEKQEPNRPISGFVVDTSGEQDVLYVSWRQQNRLTDPNRKPNIPVMSVSTDGGATFSEPINLVGQKFADPAVRAEALKVVVPPLLPRRLPPPHPRGPPWGLPCCVPERLGCRVPDGLRKRVARCAERRGAGVSSRLPLSITAALSLRVRSTTARFSRLES